MHLLDLAGEVKKGVKAAGLIGYRFNTVGVSDGMSMGTRGMSYSLQSRDLIADSIETVSRFVCLICIVDLHLLAGYGRSMVRC
jgi:dihydroxyacid dehydratase/phosphogluconate dehydratase